MRKPTKKKEGEKQKTTKNPRQVPTGRWPKRASRSGRGDVLLEEIREITVGIGKSIEITKKRSKKKSIPKSICLRWRG